MYLVDHETQGNTLYSTFQKMERDDKMRRCNSKGWKGFRPSPPLCQPGSPLQAYKQLSVYTPRNQRICSQEAQQTAPVGRFWELHRHNCPYMAEVPALIIPRVFFLWLMQKPSEVRRILQSTMGKSQGSQKAWG